MGELVGGALRKEMEGIVWVGDTVNKPGGVFHIGLEAVHKEGAGKRGGPKGLA